MELIGDAVRGAPAARRGGRADRRAGVRRRDVPLPGRPVGAADHRAVPGGTPGRRAGDLPAGPRPCSRTSSVSLPDPDCRSSSDGSWSTTRPSASAIARRERSKTTREPGTCRRSSAELVGRETEIAAVSDLLASHRLVEIVGPGGIGKTAVAIATGRRLATDVARWGLAGQARNRDDRGRRPRHGDRRTARHRRRGGAARAAQGLRRGGDPRQLRARARRRRGARGAPARRRPGAADPVHQPGSRSMSTARPCSSSRPWRSPRPWSCSPAAPPHATGTPRGRRRGARPVPLARRPAAGDRARRGTHEDLVDRGDQPPPRRPVQRAERPDQPQAGAPPRTEGHDPVELRAARSPTTSGACGRWPRSPAARRSPRSSPCSRRSTSPRRRRSTSWDGSRAARSSSSTTTVRRPVPAARQHPRVRARSDGARAG